MLRTNPRMAQSAYDLQQQQTQQAIQMQIEHMQQQQRQAASPGVIPGNAYQAEIDANAYMAVRREQGRREDEK